MSSLHTVSPRELAIIVNSIHEDVIAAGGTAVDADQAAKFLAALLNANPGANSNYVTSQVNFYLDNVPAAHAESNVIAAHIGLLDQKARNDFLFRSTGEVPIVDQDVIDADTAQRVQENYDKSVDFSFDRLILQDKEPRAPITPIPPDPGT